jgi:hypothetical protein
MTGETSASIRAEILKKRVSCGGRGTARLKGGDLPTRIALPIKPRNGRRCRLRADVGIFILSHFLSMAPIPAALVRASSLLELPDRPLPPHLNGHLLSQVYRAPAERYLKRFVLPPSQVARVTGFAPVTT